jgi:rhodanese-related sulfurtransferase
MKIHEIKEQATVYKDISESTYRSYHALAKVKEMLMRGDSIETVLDTIKNKETPIVVYCTLGVRSEMIAAKLQKAGYIDVKNLYGGISEWKNKEYKVIDSTQNTTNNIHTFSKEWSKWLLNGNPIY